MNRNIVRVPAVLFLALTCLSMSRQPLRAESETMDKVERFLGIEKWNLKTIEKDSKTGKPTLERGEDDGNLVERKTKYFSNGKKSKQETQVTSKKFSKPIYTEKISYERGGQVKEEFTEGNSYNDQGEQVKGQRASKEFNKGRAVKEKKEQWTDKDGWEDTYRQSQSYYSDGDLKERVTENFIAQEKTKESWGPKQSDGNRKVETHKWDAEASTWE